jgi:hypothetical protein
MFGPVAAACGSAGASSREHAASDKMTVSSEHSVNRRDFIDSPLSRQSAGFIVNFGSVVNYIATGGA